MSTENYNNLIVYRHINFLEMLLHNEKNYKMNIYLVDKLKLVHGVV